jgi:glutathione S-transferase
MVALNVYGYLKATCTQRVLILLEELELKYDFYSIDLPKGEQKEAEYKALQPFGKVPAVEYGDKKLFESRAILRYIAKQNRDALDLYGDFNADMWLEVESCNFHPHASKIVWERVWKGGEPDEELVARELKSLEEVLDVYEKRLESMEYIAGDRFTIADISHIPYAYALLKCGCKDVFRSRPNVYSWLKRIMKRPAVRSVLEGGLFE